MQAAELLAIIVPGAPGQAGAPGLANGVGKGGVGKAGGAMAGEGLFDGSTDQGQAAEAVNPFAQALAALMAASGQSVVQTAAAEPPQQAGQPGADATADTPNKGLQTAMAATAKTGAPALGLVKLLADTGAPAETTEQSGETAPQVEGTATATVQTLAQADTAPPQPPQTPALTDQIPPVTAKTAPQTDKTSPKTHETLALTDEILPQTDKTPPETAKTLPATANADEALDRRLASPPPRSERAEAVAKGPHLPAWASAPASPASTDTTAVAGASAPAQVPEPETVEAAAAQTASANPTVASPGEEPPAVLAMAASETAPQTVSKPAAPPRADGKALGKVEGKDSAGEESAPDHHAQGVGKGLATAPGQLKKTESDAETTGAPATEPQLAKADVAVPLADGSSLPIADPAHAAATTAAHGDAGKLAAHTVAHLAEQIVSKSDGKATRFDVQLDPAGLGKVDVRIEIGRGGEISAAMSFDNPIAAAEMRSRASELRSALEQAGFDLGKGGLSFDFSGQNPGRNLWDQNFEAPRPSWARGAFTDLAALADTPSQARWRQIDADSVDVTV